MGADFSDLIGDDLNDLVELIAQELNDREALKLAKRLLKDFEQAGKAALLNHIKPGDTDTIEAIALLCLSSECLIRVAQAITVSNEDEPADWESAYTIAGPLISYMAENLDRYSCYNDVSFEEFGRFLVEFSQDIEWFGGSCESPTFLMGGYLCAVVSILCNNHDAVDKYENIATTIPTKIMCYGGVAAEEKEVLEDVLG